MRRIHWIELPAIDLKKRSEVGGLLFFQKEIETSLGNSLLIAVWVGDL